MSLSHRRGGSLCPPESLTLPRPGHVTVIGAGSWGTSLAILLCGNIDRVTLWGRNPDTLYPLIRDRRNDHYLPGVNLPDNLVVEPDLDRAINDELCFVVVVPSHAFHQALSDLKTRIEARGKNPASATLIWGAKGFDTHCGGLLSDTAARIFPDTEKLGVLSGPSFALETARLLPTALTLASKSATHAQSMAMWFRTPSARVYFSDDPIGVQLGGAIKNVMAIAAGISDGLGYGANARAALITRGLSEMSRLGVALGGKPETFMGLTGVGDLILTCTDDQSRNRRLGLGLGAGRPRDEVAAEIGQEIEGIHTVTELFRLSRQRRIDMPITEQVYNIVRHNANPGAAVEKLLQRDPGAEF